MLGVAFREAQRSQEIGMKMRQNSAADDTSKQSGTSTLSSSTGGSNGSGKRTRRRRRTKKKTGDGEGGGDAASHEAKKKHDAPMMKKDLYFCLRCGMVRIGARSTEQAVGRVTVVNWDNQVVLDSFVKVPVPVTDYQTESTGIRAAYLQSDSAITFEQARSKLCHLMRGKILIGHGLEVDLSCLGISHPWSDIRDTATYAPFMKEVVDPLTVMLLPRDLGSLVMDELKRCPAMGPVEEAISILDLYKKVRTEWEAQLIKVAQQKERQREMVRNMRASGSGGKPPLITKPVITHLSAIREDQTTSMNRGFIPPSSIYHTGAGDDISDVSSFLSGVGISETLPPPGPPPGFAGGNGHQIENLHEVMEGNRLNHHAKSYGGGPVTGRTSPSSGTYSFDHPDAARYSYDIHSDTTPQAPVSADQYLWAGDDNSVGVLSHTSNQSHHSNLSGAPSHHSGLSGAHSNSHHSAAGGSCWSGSGAPAVAPAPYVDSGVWSAPTDNATPQYPSGDASHLTGLFTAGEDLLPANLVAEMNADTGQIEC